MELVVNGERHQVEPAPAERLVETLRDTLQLTGTKVGCGRGECGACTVLMGERPVLACVALTSTVTAPVTTVEGMAALDTGLEEAFASEGGFQCGFCTPGQLLSAHAWMSARATEGGTDVDEDEVRAAMNGNVCRCTGYAGIVRAIQSAVKEQNS